MSKPPFAFALPSGFNLNEIMPSDGIYTKAQKDKGRARTGKTSCTGKGAAERHKQKRDATRTERRTAQRSRARSTDKQSRMNNIAVFDTETNPFNNQTKERIVPFLGVIYADEFPPIVIWDNDFTSWLNRVADAFAALPAPYTVYAHNGGKFDWQFLLSKLTGQVQFKGSGLMKARLGAHELRDSLHIIPVKLAAISKEEIDYALFEPHLRDAHRDEITSYCISDCANLLPVIKAFRAEFGDALTIGSAASTEVAKHYKVGTLGEHTDAYFRQFYFGGRVELLAGRGTFRGPYKLYDINSAYPDAMANRRHPISSTFTVYDAKPAIRENTTFIELTCCNKGALVTFDPDTATLTTRVPHGRFFTTIHEYRTALELRLISDITLHRTIDFHEHSDFKDFILPRYDQRALLKDLLELNPDDKTLQRKSFFIKLILNNGYGRWAINPRNFKDMELCLPGVPPTQADMKPFHINPEYTIWARPAIRQRFGNVATAASITGGTRATLMRAVHNAVSPIYCDTDSLICLSLNNTELHPSKLGAWSLEAEFDEIHVAAKKLYAAKNTTTGKEKVRAKGINGLTLFEVADLVDGKTIIKTLNSPTFKADGTQRYITRTLRAA
jgi:hypothetical protein